MKKSSKWYAMQKKTLKRKIKQEYPTTAHEAFLASGRKIFDAKTINYRLAEIKQNQKDGRWQTPQVAGDWTYFDKYKPNHAYALGADVAEGVGLDSSTCVIIDFTAKTPIVVARYANKWIAPDVFAYEIVAGAKAYGNPLVAVERNNIGHTTVTTLKEIYPNLFFETINDRLLNKETDRLGFLTTRSSKPRILFGFRNAMEEGDIEIPDRVILREAQRFDHKDLSVLKLAQDEEEASRHFDVLMAACIAYEMKDYVGFGGTKPSLTEPQLVNPHRTLQ